MKNKLIYLLIIIFATSCSTSLRVEKRRYFQGFYVQDKIIKKNKFHIDNKKTTDVIESYVVKDHEAERFNKKTTDELSSLEGMLSISTKDIGVNIYEKLFSKEDSCAVIWLRNGGKIEANIIEISSKEIKYKKCNNPYSPLYIIDNKNVIKIVYPDGDEDYLDNKYDNDDTNDDNYDEPEKEEKVYPQQIVIQQPTKPTNEINGGALAALIIGSIFLPAGVFVLLFLSILIGAIAGVLGLILLIVGGASLKKKKKYEPNDCTIFFMNGRIISGEILVKKDNYIKIREESGLINTYNMNDIAKIDCLE